jgi:hypothetical protein
MRNTGKTYKICFTSSKKVAERFKDKCIISMFPKNLLSSCSFTLLFRLGIINNIIKFSQNINRFVKCKYYRYSPSIQLYPDALYFNTPDIVKTFQPALLPPPESYRTELDIFNSIKKYFTNLSYTDFPSYKYLSNVYDINYAVQNYFTAISVLGQIYGNNTGEAYFNSDNINLTSYSNQYLYVLALNQNKLNVALSSNVQIYNSSTLANIVTGGTIITSPNLPSFTSKSYPFIKENTMPLYSLTCYSIASILSSNKCTSIRIVERLAYSPINFNHPSNEYSGTAISFIGDQLTQEQLTYLNMVYSITLTTI